MPSHTFAPLAVARRPLLYPARRSRTASGSLPTQFAQSRMILPLSPDIMISNARSYSV